MLLGKAGAGGEAKGIMAKECEMTWKLWDTYDSIILLLQKDSPVGLKTMYTGQVHQIICGISSMKVTY